ncbi:serine/threonine-protein phosphatase 2A regulatory subunit B'' subunit delta-like [Bacillus rossius redtenbacheri]|uniref:serine/threonine-protein phosphatase 2A regulatory subunit B'' subunit delta-like n=1 Tax=Bacillus rossius redtenbacheri TaxID=93214 RepID=UPI002FDE5090
MQLRKWGPTSYAERLPSGRPLKVHRDDLRLVSDGVKDTGGLAQGRVTPNPTPTTPVIPNEDPEATGTEFVTSSPATGEREVKQQASYLASRTKPFNCRAQRKAPLHVPKPLILAAGGEEALTAGSASCEDLITFWKRLPATGRDEAGRVVFLLSRADGEEFGLHRLRPLVEDVFDSHPGLARLRREGGRRHHYVATASYIEPVLAVVAYRVCRGWAGRRAGRVAAAELRRSDLLAAVRRLQEPRHHHHDGDVDVDALPYFGVRQHAVTRRAFLDLRRPGLNHVDRRRLRRYDRGGLPRRVVERVFEVGTSAGGGQGRMTYQEFVWFLLAEVDKQHPAAIEFWFR